MNGEMSIVIQEGNEQFELHPDTVIAIGEIAARNQVEIPDAIQLSIVNEKFLMDLEAGGWRFIIEQGRDHFRYLERT